MSAFHRSLGPPEAHAGADAQYAGLHLGHCVELESLTFRLVGRHALCTASTADALECIATILGTMITSRPRYFESLVVFFGRLHVTHRYFPKKAPLSAPARALEDAVLRIDSLRSVVLYPWDHSGKTADPFHPRDRADFDEIFPRLHEHGILSVR